MARPIQTEFRRHQQPGWPGQLARPNQPFAYDTFQLHVPANGRKARPGDGVVYDAAENQVKVPTSDAEELQVIGIVAYDQGTVQGTLSAFPANANSDAFIEFEDNDIVKIAVMGTFFAVAGGAAEYGQLLRFQNNDWKWDADDPAAIGDLFHRSVELVSRSAADGNIVQVRIGYGRVL